MFLRILILLTYAGFLIDADKGKGTNARPGVKVSTDRSPVKIREGEGEAEKGEAGEGGAGEGGAGEGGAGEGGAGEGGEGGEGEGGAGEDGAGKGGAGEGEASTEPASESPESSSVSSDDDFVDDKTIVATESVPDDSNNNANTTAAEPEDEEVSSLEDVIYLGAQRSNFSSMVSIRNGTEGNNKHFCGGSMISASTILTTAHCIGRRKKKCLFVVPGVLQWDEKKDAYKVKKVIKHPYFGLNREIFDYCLLQLEKPISSDIKPLKLPEKYTPTFTDVKVIGWGHLTVDVGTFIKPKSKDLYEINMRTVSKGRCERVLHFTKIIHDGEICAETMNLDRCVAESGGPVIFGENTLVAMVSYGTHVCNRRKPDVFLRVLNFVNWMKKNMG